VPARRWRVILNWLVGGLQLAQGPIRAKGWAPPTPFPPTEVLASAPGAGTLKQLSFLDKQHRPHPSFHRLPDQTATNFSDHTATG